MKLGMNVPLATDGPEFLTVRSLDMATAPLLGSGGSWAAYMWSSNWINLIPTSAAASSMNIPMLYGAEVGTAQGTTASPQGPADSTNGNGTAATLTITASSGSGYTFSYNSGAASSSSFAWNATAAQIQTSLNSTAGVTGALVTASQTSGTFLITFPATSSITSSLLTTTVAGNLRTYALMSLTDVAAGIWDAMFTPAFQTIAGVRPASWLRIGWELYIGSSWPWAYQAVGTQHCAAYQHLVTLARTVSASFQFDWNGAINWSDFGPYGWDPMTTTGVYPGNSYVNAISCDFYDLPYFGFGASGWAASLPLIQQGLAFAQSKGLPFCISEFGCGENWGQADDPGWIEAAYGWARSVAPSLGWINFFQNVAGGNVGSLQNNPQSAAVYTQLFGAWARELQGQSSYRFVTAGSNRLRA